jgi:O-antigen ligase
MTHSAFDKLFQSGRPVWYEWPLLIYFALHFFPPGPPALANGCLLLAVCGVAYASRSKPDRIKQLMNAPLLWLWLGFAGLIGISILQAPEALRPESWHRFMTDFGKGSLFALVLALHLDRSEKFGRLFMAATLAMLVMLVHYAFTTWQIVRSTGIFPVQRDYLYWLLFFLPLAVGNYLLSRNWRLFAAIAVVFTLALAVTTGFRGALLSIVMMLVLMFIYFRVWGLLAWGVVLAGLGVVAMTVFWPEQGTYVLSKMQQVSSSNRVTGIWIPGWEMSLNAPWFGHGFGHHVFRESYLLALEQQPAGWTPMDDGVHGFAPASPHNIYLETLFVAGFPGLLAHLVILAMAFHGLLAAIRRAAGLVNRGDSRIIAMVLLICGLGNFVIFPTFETPAWRSLPIWLAMVLALLVQVKTAERVVES